MLTERQLKNFWNKVDKNGPVPDHMPHLGRCWLWTGAKNAQGYGLAGNGSSKCIRAHRRSWEIANGPIPPGIDILHHCDRTGCIRPYHLFAGDDFDNQRDAVRKGRHKHGYVKGEASGRSKLKTADVLVIRSEYAIGRSITSLARQFHVGAA